MWERSRVLGFSGLEVYCSGFMGFRVSGLGVYGGFGFRGLGVSGFRLEGLLPQLPHAASRVCNEPFRGLLSGKP